MQPWIKEIFARNPYYVNHAIISSLISAAVVFGFYLLKAEILWPGVLFGPAFYAVRETIQTFEKGWIDTKGILGGMVPLFALPVF